MQKFKNLFFILMVASALVLVHCSKDEGDDRFELLTRPVWVTDSLLANGINAGNFGDLLYKFKGEAKFNRDGTGTFGIYTGTWWFTSNQTQIVIKSDSLPLALTNNIEELTDRSLKITTSFPDLTGMLGGEIHVRMTFKAK